MLLSTNFVTDNVKKCTPSPWTEYPHQYSSKDCRTSRLTYPDQLRHPTGNLKEKFFHTVRTLKMVISETIKNKVVIDRRGLLIYDGISIHLFVLSKLFL